MSLTVTKLDRESLGNNKALFESSTFMQTLFWGDLKSEYGFKPIYFLIEKDDVRSGLVVMVRPIFKGYSLAYVPHGPAKEISLSSDLEEISSSLKPYLPKKCLFIRYDLLTGSTGDNYPLPLKGRLRKSSVSIQVPDTTVLNIEPTEDELLKAMHKKTRYNIKLAVKKGVTVREASIDEIDKWYDMYEVTAKRDAIAIHSKDYYKSVYNRSKNYENVDMKFLFAEHEDDLLAGIFVLIHGNAATYLYGASSNVKRNLMPAYLLQWDAIKKVKKIGCSSYDFFGIPPVNDSKHPMYGLYRFKIGFGGEIYHRHGCYDYSLSSLAMVFRILESLRNFYFKRIKKR